MANLSNFLASTYRGIPGASGATGISNVPGATGTAGINGATGAFGTTNWTLSEVAGTLYFAYQGSNKFQVSPTGIMSMVNNIVDLSSGTNIDCSLGTYYKKTITTATTLTVSSVPSGEHAFTLELTQTSGSVTWWNNVYWPNNIAPTITAGRVSLFMFTTINGGSSWRGSYLSNYLG